MFQTILIGYDEPERGGEAIALAQTLRGPHTGALVLTSVCPPDELGVPRDQAEELLLVARDGLPDRDQVTIRAIPSDSAARALGEMAEVEHADLIVVGSSRRSETAERLLQDAPCPVAVAPRGYGGRDIRRIGVAHDGSPEADGALRAAESLALELSAALTVYCVVEPGLPSRAATERARRLLHGVVDKALPGIRPEWLLLQAVPAEEIAGRAYGVIDLLFVGSPAEGPLRHALLGDVSDALVRAAGCPVVVTPRTAVTPRSGLEAAAAQSA
jgi:nucleotide-binding universal stress UspA family protein